MASSVRPAIQTVHRLNGLGAYDLTLDDAIIYDWSCRMNALARNTGDGRRVSYEEIEGAILSVSINSKDIRNPNAGLSM